MHLLVSSFYVTFLIFSSVSLSQAYHSQGTKSVVEYKGIQTNNGTETQSGLVENDDDKSEEILEDTDFEDDETEELVNLLGSDTQNVHSVTHLHQERGEVLVPCFGMWWPVGGTTYDYVGDYYGDYRKKRRRSRKQKKSAKSKRKKS